MDGLATVSIILNNYKVLTYKMDENVAGLVSDLSIKTLLWLSHFHVLNSLTSPKNVIFKETT